MKIKDFIKTILLFLLTFLLGAQTTYAKTEFVLPQNQVSFSIEQNQSFQFLEKELQPNIGFLKEKTKFVVLQSISAQNTYNFSERVSEYLANAGRNIPTTLATKLGNTLNIETWLVKYADDIGDATPLLNQLDNSIGSRNVLTHLEDAQGRLVTVIERPGQSNLVSVVHKDVNGSYKLTEFSPGYNPSLNPSISAPLSANKLVPDFSTTQYMHPLNQGQTIKIKMSGKRNGSTGDFALANAEMKKISPNFVKPQGYTWHHLDDFNPVTGECTMQLVESSAHQGAGVTGMQHSGSVEQWKSYYGTSNNAPSNLFYQN